jgi:hypothetical protein
MNTHQRNDFLKAEADKRNVTVLIPEDPGAGAMISKKALLFEILTKVTTQNL